MFGPDDTMKRRQRVLLGRASWHVRDRRGFGYDGGEPRRSGPPM